MTGWIIAGSILLFILILLLSRATVIVDYDRDLFVKVKYFGITVYKEPGTAKSPKKSSKKTSEITKKTSEADTKAEAKPETKKKADEDSRKKVIQRPKTFFGMLLFPFKLLLIGLGKLLKRIFTRIASSYKSIFTQNAQSEPSEESEEDEKSPKKKTAEAPTFDELMELLRMALDSLGKPLKKVLKRISFSHLSFDAVCGGDDAAKAAINYGAMNIALGSVLNLIDQFFTLKVPDDLNIDVDFYREKTEIKLYCEVRTTVGSALAFVFSLIGRAIKNYLGRRLARSAIKKLAG